MPLIADRNIISCKTAQYATYASRNSTSWGEFNTAYRINYAPKLSTSVILVDFYFVVQTSVQHVLQSWRIYNVTDSAYLANNGNLSSRNWVHAQSRGQYNADNANSLHVYATYSPGSTSSKTYALYHRNASGSTTYIGYSASDGTSAVQWRHSPQITVYEIAPLNQ